MSKEEKCLIKWKKIKNQGLMSYIVKMAIIYYGLTFFLIWVLLIPVIDNNFAFSLIHNETFNTKLNQYVIIAPLLGMVMGYIRYKRFEKKYE